MKIGILAGRVPPPVFINQLVSCLADAGHKVYLYGSSHGKNFQYNNPLLFVRIIPQNKIFLLFNSLLLILKIIIISHRNAFSILSQIKSQEIGVRNFLNRCNRVLPPFLDDLDIFHIQWAKSLVYYPEFIENLNCPVVLSLRGAHINYSPLGNKNLAQGYIKYFPLITGFHAVSDAIAREAEKYGAESQKMTVIRPAVKLELIKYGTAKQTNISKKLLKIISVGRCHWKKGYTFALDAIAILKKEGIKFHYTIIANGRDHEHINYQIQDLGLNEVVTFINGLTHNKVIKKVSESDLFFLSSVEEGISNAVLEAMALGIPVVTTNCGGMAEVIQNEINGFLVEVREPLQISAAIQSFINLSNHKKMDLINYARKTIMDNHLLSNQVNQMLSFYTSTNDGFGVKKY